MKRRQIITSLCAIVGAGGSAAGAAKPSISKNSTRCQISERAVGQVGNLQRVGNPLGHSLNPTTGIVK